MPARNWNPWSSSYDRRASERPGSARAPGDRRFMALRSCPDQRKQIKESDPDNSDPVPIASSGRHRRRGSTNDAARLTGGMSQPVSRPGDAGGVTKWRSNRPPLPGEWGAAAVEGDPGDDRLSRQRHYHGPGGLNGRVRDGNGCGPAGMVAGKSAGGRSGRAGRVVAIGRSIAQSVGHAGRVGWWWRSRSLRGRGVVGSR